MSNDGNPSATGYVASGLAVLVALGVGIKSLFGRGPDDGVTRREFDDLKGLTHEALRELKDQMLQVNIALAEIRAWLKPPNKQ